MVECEACWRTDFGGSPVPLELDECRPRPFSFVRDEAGCQGLRPDSDWTVRTVAKHKCVTSGSQAYCTQTRREWSDMENGRTSGGKKSGMLIIPPGYTRGIEVGPRAAHTHWLWCYCSTAEMTPEFPTDVVTTGVHWSSSAQAAAGGFRGQEARGRNTCQVSAGGPAAN